MDYGFILEAFWFILPAYVANMAATDVSVLPFLKKFNQPIDGGVKWHGTRLLGEGKTWRGLVFGVLAGVLAGWIQSMYHTQAAGLVSSLLSEPVNLPVMTITLAFMISLGALTGDLIASFGKRRIGLESGSLAPLLDQLDYIIGAFIFSWFVVEPDIEMFGVIVLMTIPLHLFANLAAWLLRIKKVPW